MNRQMNYSFVVNSGIPFMHKIKQVCKCNLILKPFIILLVSCAGGGNPRPVHEEPPEDIKPIVSNVNVYMENSGSMDGYVNGPSTEFKVSVFNYLSDIKLADIADSLNLYYINSQKFLFRSKGADMDVIDDFVQKLSPAEFRERGGDRGRSDIADIIKNILHETGKNDIAIMVTDGVFSPGKGRDASSYLVNQQVGIKGSIGEYFKKQPEAAVIVYQLSSRFNGTYYDKFDNKYPLKSVDRPFYIWVIGQSEALASLRARVPEEKFAETGNALKKMFTAMAGNQKVDYSIKKDSGKFKVSRKNPKTEIEDIEADRDGKVQFAIKVNFDKLLLDDDYLLDVNNYEFNDKYSMKVKPIEGKSKYTHTLIFSAKESDVRNGDFVVKLKMTEPNWDEENDDEGNGPIKGKTFGIKYQILGVYQAVPNSKYYTEIKISLKK